MASKQSDNNSDRKPDFWQRFDAEKQALYKKQIIQGIFMALGVFTLPFVLLFVIVLISGQSRAGDLPPNPIGIVNYTTPGTYVNFSYSFTAPTTGVDYFGLAIRQDPGYWGVGNFSLTAGSNSTNLLLNPNLQYGGTTNTQYGLQAPANWGIWYQSSAGAPPAAGQYYAPGSGWMGTYTGGLGVNTSTAGTWIDGAVGTFDGIYQGVSVRAGTTYNFSFSLNGTQRSNNPSIAIGAYAGSCASGSTVFSCTPAASSGFTAAATPAQTQGTGGAPIPPPPPPSSGPVFTDLRFGRYQVADSQWNVSSCTQTNTCQIYSTNPGTAYRIPWTSGQWNWQPGQYIQFSTTGNSANPYEAKVYNSDGTPAGTIGTGHILSMGTDSSGHSLFFFVGNDNNTGQLFSTNYGFSGNGGYTWTGTLNPSTSQVDTFADSGSTTPLASGESAGGGSSAPTVTSTSTSNDTSTTSSTTNNFQSTLVNDVSFTNGTVSYYDSIVYGTDTTTTTTTVTTPVTTTTWSDGTSTTSRGTSSTAVSIIDTYDVWKVYEIPQWNYTIPVVSGNSIYLNQSGSNPSITIEQVGQHNTVAGVNNPSAYLVGNNNSLVIRQSGDDNLTLANASGNNNSIQIPQGYYHNWANGAEYPASGSANDIAMVNILGNGNWDFMAQQGYRNLATSTTNGNSNNNTIVQYGNDNKTYNIINGDGNSLSSWQQGNGNLSTISMTGNNNQANVTQTGNNNSSTITLANAGGPSSVSVTQTNNGTGVGNLLSIQQQCATLSGCSVTINQTK